MTSDARSGLLPLLPWLRRLREVAVPASLPTLRLFSTLRDRIGAAPASTREQFHGAYPGGLAQHLASTAEAAQALTGALNATIPEASLILVSLLHDIGKIGDQDRPYYIPQTSDWHRNRGSIYEISQALTVMSVPDRSLWWCSRFQIPLTTEEWQAIRYINSIHGHDNLGRGEVAFHETDLLWVCASAKAWAIRVEKRRAQEAR